MEESILQLEKQIEEQRENREYQDIYYFERTGLLYAYQKIATAYKKEKIERNIYQTLCPIHRH